MKKQLKKAVLLFLLSISIFSFGQDEIVKKDGKKMKVIIKEMTDTSIKYVEYADPNGVVFTIPKAMVRSVEFSYGKKMDVENTLDSDLYYVDDKKNNFTLNFLALGGNTLALGYERSIKPGHSIFTEAKIYGAGIKTRDEYSRSGFGIDFAYRLKIKTLFDGTSYRPKHILNGAYFSPVIGFSTGEITEGYYWGGNYTYKHTIGHFGLQYGKQWILDNTLSIDTSVGFHYYVGDSYEVGATSEYASDLVRIGNMTGADSKLVSFNVRIGFLTAKKKK